MREIKFRAWDKKYSEMIFTGFHVLGEVTAFSQIEQYLFERKQVDNIPTIERWNDIELMQFTGLKDKNGKEIYEGDICLTDEAGWKGIVIYNRDLFMLKDKYGGYSSLCNWERFEIIGNIYENQDLLQN